ncbi:MAG: sigma-70 family RNA polymerase sigma factor [Microbacteriaceae bacterium]|nr:sigma-70 family RNA polymerase sigma factor [Microbacteriaceae bacterium]MCL2794896.1 sigma-70 family RNA polymerase sigma factor [Microbacteriaceae bacterium]
MRESLGDDQLIALVRRAQSGDTGAVGAVIRGLRTRIFRYALARIGRREEAEDVTQETCLALTSALPGFDPDTGRFTSFVFGIASNKVLMAQRSRGRRPEVPVAELPDERAAEPGPAELAERGDTLRRLLAHLDELPDKHRDVLLMRVVAGLSADEVGEALGVTAANVRVIQHRALSSLRSRLGAVGDAFTADTAEGGE